MPQVGPKQNRSCRDGLRGQGENRTQNVTVVQHGMHRGPRDAPQLRPRRRATCTIAPPSTCVPGPRRVDYGTRGHHGRSRWPPRPLAQRGNRSPTGGAALSTTADHAGQRSLAERLGVQPGMVVHELGYDDDVDEELRRSVVERSGGELVAEASDEIVDVVLLWWREGDGDLVDTLVDALTPLAANGVVWLLTPKAGREGHVEPSDISEAAPTAGLNQTSSISNAADWSGARLVAPRSSRSARR